MAVGGAVTLRPLAAPRRGRLRVGPHHRWPVAGGAGGKEYSQHVLHGYTNTRKHTWQPTLGRYLGGVGVGPWVVWLCTGVEWEEGVEVCGDGED